MLSIRNKFTVYSLIAARFKPCHLICSKPFDQPTGLNKPTIQTLSKLTFGYKTRLVVALYLFAVKDYLVCTCLQSSVKTLVPIVKVQTIRPAPGCKLTASHYELPIYTST